MRQRLEKKSSERLEAGKRQEGEPVASNTRLDLGRHLSARARSVERRALSVERQAWHSSSQQQAYQSNPGWLAGLF